MENPDFVACHNASYVNFYDVLKGLKDGGTFLLNTVWNEEQLEKNLPPKMKRYEEQLEKNLPPKMKRYLANHAINFYTIDAMNLAKEVGMGRRINTIMQTAFFKLTDILPFDEVFPILKASVIKDYGKKSQEIVDQNFAAMEGTLAKLKKIDVPKEWQQAKKIRTESENHLPDFFFNISKPVNALEGDKLSVKDLKDNGLEDGAMPLGTTQYEKRGVALEVPKWDPDYCIECNACSFVCPHAAIRPILADEEEMKEEMKEAPEGFIVRDMKGPDGLKYRIQVSIEDCTGCGLCVEACPHKGKALKMETYESQKEQAMNWAFAMTLSTKENPSKNQHTVIGSQFNKPLIEFSSACPGCGETPYLKLITQMYGDRMLIANAHGLFFYLWWGLSSYPLYNKR